MFLILFYSFTSIILLFVMGVGLSILLTPQQWKGYSFWLAPWFAIIFSILILTSLNLTGLSIQQTFIPLSLALCAISYYALFIKRKKFTINVQETAVILFFITAGTIFNLFPLFQSEKILTTISLGNNDAVNYAFSADLMKTHLLFRDSITHIVSAHTMFYQIYRWGPSILAGFLSSIFNLAGYQYIYILQVLLFSLTIPLIYILFKLIYKTSTLFSLIFTLAIVVFNANLLYILYHNFFGQILFWGLWLFLVIFFLFYLCSKKTKQSHLGGYTIIIGVALGVLLLSYNEGVIFIILPSAVYLILKSIFDKKRLREYLLFLVKVFSIAGFIGIIPIRYTIFNLFARFLSGTSGGNPQAAIGWPPFRTSIPYPNPYEILGFYSIHSFEPLFFLIAVLLSFLTVIISIYGFLKIKQKLFVISFLLIYALLFIWSNNYFDYYKVVTYSLFLFLILFTVGLFELFKQKKIILFTTAIILIALEIFMAVKLNKKMNQTRLSANSSLTSLLSFNKQLDKHTTIYAPPSLSRETTIWQALWREYFLYPNKVIIYAPQNVLFNKKTLVMVSKQSSRVLFKDIVRENNYYILGTLCNSDTCLTKANEDLSHVKMGESPYEDTLLLEGWSIGEPNHRWANSLTSTLRLVKHEKPTNLQIEARSLVENQIMSTYVNDVLIATQNISTNWASYTIPLYQWSENGLYRILLVFSKTSTPVALHISPDTRELTVDFKHISLK